MTTDRAAVHVVDADFNDDEVIVTFSTGVTATYPAHFLLSSCESGAGVVIPPSEAERLHAESKDGFPDLPATSQRED